MSDNLTMVLPSRFSIYLNSHGRRVFTVWQLSSDKYCSFCETRVRIYEMVNIRKMETQSVPHRCIICARLVVFAFTENPFQDSVSHTQVEILSEGGPEVTVPLRILQDQSTLKFSVEGSHDAA